VSGGLNLGSAKPPGIGRVLLSRREWEGHFACQILRCRRVDGVQHGPGRMPTGQRRWHFPDRFLKVLQVHEGQKVDEGNAMGLASRNQFNHFLIISKSGSQEHERLRGSA